MKTSKTISKQNEGITESLLNKTLFGKMITSAMKSSGGFGSWDGGDDEDEQGDKEGLGWISKMVPIGCYMKVIGGQWGGKVALQRWLKQHKTRLTTNRIILRFGILRIAQRLDSLSSIGSIGIHCSLLIMRLDVGGSKVVYDAGYLSTSNDAKGVCVS